MRTVARIVLWGLLFAFFPLAPIGCTKRDAPEGPERTEAKAAATSAPAPMPLLARGVEAGEKGDEERVETWKRSTRRPNAARLSVGDKEELPLRGMQINVRIEGFRARVVLDCWFENTRHRTLEGTFQLRLPDEASPYFFAFGETQAKAAEPPPFFPADVAGRLGADPAAIVADRAATWSAPKEARMVPREKAAVAYRETVRRAVDPALIEWAGAGVFDARVFPLAPGKVHRVVVGYEADLTWAGNDLEYLVDLPESVPHAVVDVSVVPPGKARATVTPKAAPLATEGGRLRFRFEDPKERTIAVRIERPGPVAIAGEDSRTGAYFAASFRPDVPGGPALAASPKRVRASSGAARQPAARPAAARTGGAIGRDAAVFLVDTSLSANPDAFNVWLALLEQILTRNRDVLSRFAVLFFNVETVWYEPRFIENTPERVERLLAHARTLALEGATDLGAALREAARPAWLEGAAGGPWDVFLLSDGAATWGEPDVFALARALASGGAGSLFAYRTGLAGMDGEVLDHLARESGGAVFSVVGEAEVPAAAVAHRARPWRIESVSVPGVTDLLVAGRPTTLFPGQVLRIAGRGAPPAKDAAAEVVLSRGEAKKTVRVPLGRPVSSSLAPRAYGDIAVAQLEQLADATERLATSYATYFRVTGKTCSLLMLDNEADYERHGVVAEDPNAIRETPAAGAIAEALRTIGEHLGDPKAAFLAWLRRLERAPGMKLAVPEPLREVLGNMPVESFAVEAPPLVTKLRAATEVPGSLRELFAMHRLDYDAVVAEAERRRGSLGPGDALKALSSLVEESPGDLVLTRDVAFSALQWGLGAHAYHLFRRAARARPHEPETYRALGACLAAIGKVDLAIAHYEIGILGEWDARFGDFRRITGMEYAHLLRRIARGELRTSAKDWAASRLATLGERFGPSRADLVVTITWNTDATDVDLHVVEPSGEECFYSHPRTKSGGELTRDVTQGYGPEMYVLPTAPRGPYAIRARYYATDRNRASTRTKVHAVVFEGWGTPEQRVTEKVVTLETGKQMHDILTVTR